MAFAVSYNSDMKRYMYEVCMKNRISGQILFKTGYNFSNKKKALRAATSIRDLVVAQKDYGVLHHHVIKCIKRARLEKPGELHVGAQRHRGDNGGPQAPVCTIGRLDLEHQLSEKMALLRSSIGDVNSGYATMLAPNLPLPFCTRRGVIFAVTAFSIQNVYLCSEAKSYFMSLTE